MTLRMSISFASRLMPAIEAALAKRGHRLGLFAAVLCWLAAVLFLYLAPIGRESM